VDKPILKNQKLDTNFIKDKSMMEDLNESVASSSRNNQSTMGLYSGDVQGVKSHFKETIAPYFNTEIRIKKQA
jgi:hypothetical protein